MSISAYTRADALEACNAIAGVLRTHGIKGPAHDGEGDELIYARQLVGFLWLSMDDPLETQLDGLIDALEERARAQRLGGGSTAARECAVECVAAWLECEATAARRDFVDGLARGGLVTPIQEVELRLPPRSNLETFADAFVGGVDPDRAARSAGGTGRTGR